MMVPKRRQSHVPQVLTWWEALGSKEQALIYIYIKF
jgi:hypothetical protein